MENLNKTLMDLKDGEARFLLSGIMSKAEAAIADPESHPPLAEQIIDLWNQHQNRKMQEKSRRNHVHILFSMSDAGSMKVALSNAGYREASDVQCFLDLFSVGPLRKIHRTEGYLSREVWFEERFIRLHAHSQFNDQHRLQNMVQTLNNIPEDKKISIWCGDNSHDQTGLRFVLHLLSNREQPLYMINASQVYRDIAEQYGPEIQPLAVGHIPNEALQDIIKLTEEAPPLTSTQRKQYEQEWQTLSGCEEMLRVWLNGQVVSVPESYYDEAILSIAASLQKSADEDGYIKVGLIVGAAIEQWNQYISDAFIEYRLWTLISEGKLLFRGIPYAMYLYYVKIPHELLK